MSGRQRHVGGAFKTSNDQDIELTNTANNGQVEMHPRYQHLPRYNHVSGHLESTTILPTFSLYTSQSKFQDYTDV